jgi:hypothetical protein
MMFPVPGIRRTRAVETFRRPVARHSLVAFIWISFELAQRERLRILRGMRVVRTVVDFEFLQLSSSEAVLREHSLDGLEDDSLGVLLKNDLCGLFLDSARVATVTCVGLLEKLCAGQDNLLRINRDYKVATVIMRGKGGLVLAAEDRRDFSRDASDRLTFEVYDMPGTGGVFGLYADGLHNVKSFLRYPPQGEGGSTRRRRQGAHL